MALLTVEGVYENGKVELAEQPAGVEHARVVVTFLPEQQREAKPVEAGAEEARRVAAESLLQEMRAGINFGGERFNREELYAERIDRIGRGDG